MKSRTAENPRKVAQNVKPPLVPVQRWIRPLVRDLDAYVPGEQPAVGGLIKLNTNENPFPPSPTVIQATRRAVDERLRLYPNPTAQSLRERLARFHGVEANQVMVGNGSDEILALAVRAFVEPREMGDAAQESPSSRSLGVNPRTLVQYFEPSYSLYPVLADSHGAARNPVPLAPDFSMPSPAELKQGRLWRFDAALTFVTSPNAPTGRGYSREELAALCEAQRGIVLLDEAYVDFSAENALELAVRFPHVLVARTFSKAYSLCFQRVGYAVGNPMLISALLKLKDSYNVNGLGQVAAMATLDDLPYYRKNFARIKKERQRLSEELAARGFIVFPSQANFILCEPPNATARRWFEALRDRKILVRWFNSPPVDRYLRITIGTGAQMDALLGAVQEIQENWKNLNLGSPG